MAHKAHIAHHSKGRMRIRVPSAKGDPAALQEIRQALLSVNGVNEILVNDAIGTVTIHYDHALHPDFEKHLADHPAQRKVSVQPADSPKLEDLERLDHLVEKEAAYIAGHSHTGKVLVAFVHHLDREVKRLTGNSVDLKVIAPLVLAAGAFVELGVTAATPVWLTLTLFSFNHLLEMHSQTQSADSPQEPAPEAAVKKRPRKPLRYP